EQDEDAPLSDTQLAPRGIDTAGFTGSAPGAGGARVAGDRARALAPPDRDGDADPWADYELPDLSLLHTGRVAPGNKKSLELMQRALEHAMHQFGVDARVSRVSRGPTVTRF